MQQYLRENRRPPAPPVAWPSHPHALYGVIGYALVLIAITLATLTRAGGLNWKSSGVLDAGFLERGEWWRVFTALTLHADLLHLLSNLAFGALFGYPAARLFGPGVAWLLILVGATDLVDDCERPRLDAAPAQVAQRLAAGQVLQRVDDEHCVVGERDLDALAEEVALVEPELVVQEIGIGDD